MPASEPARSVSLPRLVLGTRASPLALAQAYEVRELLRTAFGLGEEAVPVTPMTTTGDQITDRPLSDAGGKGLFTKELDAALLGGAIDFAVHSAKDLPTVLPDGLVIAGYLPREDVRDVLISRDGAGLMELPAGANVGTASLRRQAQVKRARPDLQVSLIRGNVGTRLGKIADGVADATLLALAGLKRLNLADKASAILDTSLMLPAVGQGAIALVARTGDVAVREALMQITHPETGVELAAERAFLTVLDGSCRTPIAGLARVEGARVTFRGLVLAPDGSEAEEVTREGPLAEAAALGADAAREIVARAKPALLASAHHGT